MFVKYRSLTNHHNFEAPIELLNEPVIVREKIDGSNFSIVVEKDGSYRFASRNQLVSDDWHNIKDVVGNRVLSKLSNIASSMKAEINLYGEVFNNKINRRIPYGHETRIAFFDCLFDEVLLPFPSFVKLLEDIGVAHLMPATEVMPLRKALKIDVENFHSQYTEDSIAEGIVITGYTLPMTIAVKKKSQKFCDTVAIKHEKTEASPLEEKVHGYICNPNRVKDYLSKIGEMNLAEMGQHIKAIQEDGFMDCLKDTPEEAERMLENKKSLVRGTGTEVSKLLRNEVYLQSLLC